MIYIFAGLGGAIGSLLRYSLTFLPSYGLLIPLGTLTVNLSGSFLLGWFTARYIKPQRVGPYVTAAFATGLIGSYTTFSTLAVETVQIINKGMLFTAFLYISISFIGGLFLSKLGIIAGNKGTEKRGDSND